MKDKPEILPSMKVAQFLEAFPDLEDTLIGLSPQFKKLKNPVLRRTVARLVTLQQAAATGGLPVEELINALRESSGQPALHLTDVSEDYRGEHPVWLKEARPVERLDVTETIQSGGFPLPQVCESLSRMNPGSILELTSPILPVPMIDKLRAEGFQSWSQETDGVFRTFFLKAENSM